MSLEESELPQTLTWRRNQISPKQLLAKWLDIDGLGNGLGYKELENDKWDDTGKPSDLCMTLSSGQ